MHVVDVLHRQADLVRGFGLPGDGLQLARPFERVRTGWEIVGVVEDLGHSWDVVHAVQERASHVHPAGAQLLAPGT